MNLNVSIRDPSTGQDTPLHEAVWGTQFDASCICRITGIDARVLDSWNRRGLFRASIQPSRGSGFPRLYNFSDLLALYVGALLRNGGVELAAVTRAWEAIQALGDPRRISLRAVLVMRFDGSTSIQEGPPAEGDGEGAVVVNIGRIMARLYAHELEEAAAIQVAAGTLVDLDRIGRANSDERDVDGGAIGAAATADARGNGAVVEGPTRAPAAPSA